MSSNVTVDRQSLVEFLSDWHRWVLSTTRADRRPRMSLVTGGVVGPGRLAVATDPERVGAR